MQENAAHLKTPSAFAGNQELKKEKKCQKTSSKSEEKRCEDLCRRQEASKKGNK